MVRMVDCFISHWLLNCNIVITITMTSMIVYKFGSNIKPLNSLSCSLSLSLFIGAFNLWLRLEIMVYVLCMQPLMHCGTACNKQSFNSLCAINAGAMVDCDYFFIFCELNLDQVHQKSRGFFFCEYSKKEEILFIPVLNIIYLYIYIFTMGYSLTLHQQPSGHEIWVFPRQLAT